MHAILHRASRLFALSSLSSLALLALAVGAPAARAQEDATVDAGRLKSEIDRSLRWLRSQQDLETGAYDTPLGTAWAVAAYADGPRAYRLGDGPFLDRALDHVEASIDTDGLVGGEVEANAALLLGLRRLEGERVRALEARAREGLAKAKESWPWPNLVQEFASAEVGRMVAGQFLDSDERREDGAWTGPRGPVTETAQMAWELSRARRAIALEETGGAGSRETVALPDFSPADREDAVGALRRGAAFLAGAADEGRWGTENRIDPGITAMVVGALIVVPGELPEAAAAELDKGLDWLASLQKPDGSIHDGQLANYVTSAAVLAFVRAGREKDAGVVERARAFLVELQADEGEGYAESHRYYGGVGYGGDERPDLSNLQMALEAMRSSGLEQDDPAFAKALTFLERVQNRSESNDLVLESGDTVIASGDDGGAAYAPGESKAGFVELADGTKVPRSYGSMTYALLRGYLFAGLDKDDPRVRAAWEWLMRNYTLDVNPGFEASSDPTAPYQGLFYYFYTMARALDLYGVERVTDAAGTEHPWRRELTGRLVAMQRPDGSWVNPNSPRWWEGNPVLATAYAMLSLDAALPAK